MLSNGDQRVSVTRAAVCMGWKRQGCKQDTEEHTTGSESGMSIEMRKQLRSKSKKH